MSLDLESSVLDPSLRWPDDASPDAEAQTVMGLIELLLKNPAHLDAIERDPANQRALFPRFLLIAHAGYLVYSGVMLPLLNLAPAAASPATLPLPLPRAPWAGA